MEQYISKSALVAEIERRIKETESMRPKFDRFWAGQISAFKGVLKFLDTLEVKEIGVDIGSPEGDIGVKTIWDGDMIVSNRRHDIQNNPVDEEKLKKDRSNTV